MKERYLPDRKRKLGVCTWCQGEVKKPKKYWCGPLCIHEWKLRRDGAYLREHVFKRDKGVCGECGTNTLPCQETMRRLKRAGLACWYKKDFEAAKRIMEAFWKWGEEFGLKPPEDLHDFKAFSWSKKSLWEADHIVAVHEGGGACGLENLVTKCIRCHKAKTKEQAAARALARKEAEPTPKPKKKPAKKKPVRKTK